jgi:hypothetical protein
MTIMPLLLCILYALAGKAYWLVGASVLKIHHSKPTKLTPSFRQLHHNSALGPGGLPWNRIHPRALW